MSGVKSLTSLLLVVLFSVTVQAEALIGHRSTIHRHMKRNDVEICTKGLAGVAFDASPSLSNTTAAICYREGHDYNVEDKSATHFRPGLTRSCYMSKGWFGSYTIE